MTYIVDITIYVNKCEINLIFNTNKNIRQRDCLNLLYVREKSRCRI